MEAMNGCEDDSREFGSFLVRFVATGLYTLSSGGAGCPAEMTCPGKGPCLVDRSIDAAHRIVDRILHRSLGTQTVKALNGPAEVLSRELSLA